MTHRLPRTGEHNLEYLAKGACLNYKGTLDQGCFFFNTINQYILLLTPTDLEKNKVKNSGRIRMFKLLFIIRLSNKMRGTVYKDICGKKCKY